VSQLIETTATLEPTTTGATSEPTTFGTVGEVDKGVTAWPEATSEPTTFGIVGEVDRFTITAWPAATTPQPTTAWPAATSASLRPMRVVGTESTSVGESTSWQTTMGSVSHTTIHDFIVGSLPPVLHLLGSETTTRAPANEFVESTTAGPLVLAMVESKHTDLALSIAVVALIVAVLALFCACYRQVRAAVVAPLGHESNSQCEYNAMQV